jgi:hypothetical protein
MKAFKMCWCLFLSFYLMVIIVLSIFTSPLWIIIGIIWMPIILFTVLVFYHRSIGNFMMNGISMVTKQLLCLKQQSYLKYEGLGWIKQTGDIQDQSLTDITSFNLGYAWITRRGDMPKNYVQMPDAKNVR